MSLALNQDKWGGDSISQSWLCGGPRGVLRHLSQYPWISLAMLYGNKNKISESWITCPVSWLGISDQVCAICLIRSQASYRLLKHSFLPLVGVFSTYISQIVTVACKNNFKKKCSSMHAWVLIKNINYHWSIENQYTQCNKNALNGV